jgi:hypothetical protein
LVLAAAGCATEGRSILIKAILDKASRPLDRFEVERKFRKSRDVPPSGLSQELKEMAKRGEIDRHAAGLYWRKGTAGKPYESQPQQLYRLAHDAPGHRMRNAELAVAMDISRKDLEALLSKTRKQWCDPPLFEGPTGDGVAVVSADSLAVLKRDGRILDGRGGVFFALGVAPPVEDVTWTTLHPERPHVDFADLESEYLHIASLFPEEQNVARKDLAARGVDEKVIDLGVKRARAAKGLPADVRKAIKAASKAGCKQAYQDKMIEEPDAQDNRDVLARRMMDEFQLTWEQVRICRKDALNGKDWGKKPGRPRKSEASAPVEKTNLNRLGFRSQNPV